MWLMWLFFSADEPTDVAVEPNGIALQPCDTPAGTGAAAGTNSAAGTDTGAGAGTEDTDAAAGTDGTDAAAGTDEETSTTNPLELMVNKGY